MEIADSRIFSNLGHVQMLQGEYQKAIQNYETALVYDRNNAFAYINIAQANFEIHNFDKAIEYAHNSNQQRQEA